MLNKKFASNNSSPFSSVKQNICPNSKYPTISNTNKINNKQQQTPSLGTDSQFSIFNTINVHKMSRQNSVATKSRAEIEAILQNFSTKSSNQYQNIPYSHKSFMSLLGIMFSKQDFTIEQAIQKCEQYEISGKEQLISIMEQKQATREWPLPLSNLLLTDLGELKIMKICSQLENQEDLNDSQLEILQFLLPDTQKMEGLNRTAFLEHYNQFRSHIDQKCSLVDVLVKSYTLKVQPKLRQIKDKVALIKLQKKIKRFQKSSNGTITFNQLTSCLDVFHLNEDQKVTIFKYFYLLQNEKVLNLIDRRQTVSCSTCYRQLLERNDVPKINATVSTLQTFEQQNSHVINELLNDKNYLLETIYSKNSQIQKLKNRVLLLQFQLQNREKQHQSEKDREVANAKNKYQGMLKAFQEENKTKDNIIKWYKNQIDALVDQNKRENILKNRNTIFYDNFINSRQKEENNKTFRKRQIFQDQQMQ